MRKLSKSISAIAVVMMLAIALFTPALATSTGSGTVVTPTATSTAAVSVATANAGDSLHMFKVVDADFDPTTNTLTFEFTQLFADFMDDNTAYEMTVEEYAALDADSDALNDVLGAFTAYVKTEEPTPYAQALTDTNGEATFTGVEMGQYIVVGAGNTNGALVYQTVTAEVIPHTADGEYKIYTAYEVEMKTTEPTVEKEITGGTVTDTYDDEKETASIGDTVTYGLTINVPTYPAHATNTTFYVGDVLSAGLELDADSIVVKDANGDALTEGTHYTVAASADGDKFFIDFVYDEIKANEVVTVEYDAVITDDAVIGGDGNDNLVTLVYSNNPFNGDGWEPSDDPDDPDRPDEDDPGYGKNKDEEVVYTYGLFIDKFAKGDEDSKLIGATFEIYEGSVSGDPIAIITTDGNGIAKWDGLKSGEYYLVEIVAPTGYNLLKAPVEIEINANTAQATSSTTTTVNYTAEDNGEGQAEKDGVPVWINEDGDIIVAETKPEGYEAAYVESITTETVFIDDVAVGAGYFVSSISNDKGIQIPGTGGIGTTIFYIVGSLMMAVAVVFLITKKRMCAQTEK